MFSRGPPKSKQDAADKEEPPPSASGVGRPAGWTFETAARRPAGGLFSSASGASRSNIASGASVTQPCKVQSLSPTNKAQKPVLGLVKLQLLWT